MTRLKRSILGQYLSEWLAGWNRFWFQPRDAAMLCVLRVAVGLMLLYTHLVWTLDLQAFFGPGGWLSRDVVAEAHGEGYTWSYFWLIDSPVLLWTVHFGALAVFAALAAGYRSRTMAVLAYLAAVSYTGRAPGALFGLDKINCMLAMYLMLGPCGARYSIDSTECYRL